VPAGQPGIQAASPLWAAPKLLAQVAAPHVTDATVCEPRGHHRISRHHHRCDEEDGYGLAPLHRTLYPGPPNFQQALT
jgi:hypothetical protein